MHETHGYPLHDPKHPDNANAAQGLAEIARPIDMLANRATPAWPYVKCLVCQHDTDEHDLHGCHVPGCNCGRG